MHFCRPQGREREDSEEAKCREYIVNSGSNSMSAVFVKRRIWGAPRPPFYLLFGVHLAACGAQRATFGRLWALSRAPWHTVRAQDAGRRHSSDARGGWDFETDPPDTIQDKTPRKKLVWELPEVSLRGQASPRLLPGVQKSTQSL